MSPLQLKELGINSFNVNDWESLILSLTAFLCLMISLKNFKELITLSVLQYGLGIGHIKWSGGAGANKLAQVASKATDAPFVVRF